MSEIKTIRLSTDTYNELAQLGDLRDSFESVVKKLIMAQKKEGKVT